jgi:hypothetical protein
MILQYLASLFPPSELLPSAVHLAPKPYVVTQNTYMPVTLAFTPDQPQFDYHTPHLPSFRAQVM